MGHSNGSSNVLCDRGEDTRGSYTNRALTDSAVVSHPASSHRISLILHSSFSQRPIRAYSFPSNNLHFDVMHQTEYNIIARWSGVLNPPLPLNLLYCTSIVRQGHYSHPTKAGRTRYGSATSSESDTVSFRLKDSFDIGVPVLSAFRGCEDSVIGAQDEVLRNQGTNITLHILVRSTVNTNYVHVILTISDSTFCCSGPTSVRGRISYERRVGQLLLGQSRALSSRDD